MARILAISSEVVRGHVGLRAIVPALQALGHEVWPLPTVLLSNHPGHSRYERVEIPASKITAIVDAIEANGWLAEVDAVVTGYLPTAAHVAAAVKVLSRLKSVRTIRYLCDPVLGDHPKGLYIDARAAKALRDELLPLADVVTPNRFELGWLLEAPVSSLREVEAGARALGRPMTVVTSAAVDEERMATVLAAGDQTLRCWSALVPAAPNGSGDLLAALLLGHLVNGSAPAAALGQAVGAVAQVIAASQGNDELNLAAAGRWADAPSGEVERVVVRPNG
jgi:pyridoxine kinase